MICHNPVYSKNCSRFPKQISVTGRKLSSADKMFRIMTKVVMARVSIENIRFISPDDDCNRRLENSSAFF